jgi:hypothetical protein
VARTIAVSSADGAQTERRTVPRLVAGARVFPRGGRRSPSAPRTRASLAGDGRAFCWGANDRAQLGDGTRDDRRGPDAVRGNARFRSIAAGGGHTCGVSRDGGVL